MDEIFTAGENLMKPSCKANDQVVTILPTCDSMRQHPLCTRTCYQVKDWREEMTDPSMPCMVGNKYIGGSLSQIAFAFTLDPAEGT